MILAAIDWHAIFVPSQSLGELVLRGTVMYLFILALMRIFPREPGTLSIPDLLVVVLVADAAQNGMSAQYRSVSEGIVLVATIFAWNFVLDWLSVRSRWVHRLLHPRPLALVKDGRILRRNLRRELLTVDDLMSQLREHGIEHVREVKRSYIEDDGRLSVIKFESGSEPDDQPDRSRGVS